MKTYDPTTGDCTTTERAAYVEAELVRLRPRLSGSRMNLAMMNNDEAMGRPINHHGRTKLRQAIRSLTEQIEQYEEELVLLYGE